MAIIRCELGVEFWLRTNTEKEITHIIAENNNDVRMAAKGAHMLLRNKEEMEKEGFVDRSCLPFKRIRDGLQFTTKAESRLLQVADVCAWAIRRAANSAPNAFRFYGPMRSQIATPDNEQMAILEKAQPS
jgi:hypothetical protein